jgi:hypothetical protein
MQEIETASSQSRTGRFDHRERRRDRHGSIEGIAAFGEDFPPGFARERIRACYCARMRRCTRLGPGGQRPGTGAEREGEREGERER